MLNSVFNAAKQMAANPMHFRIKSNSGRFQKVPVLLWKQWPLEQLAEVERQESKKKISCRVSVEYVKDVWPSMK